MPRKKLELLPGQENINVDCFAFRLTRSGKPECTALNDVYCLKLPIACPFRATPAEASDAKLKAQLRLNKFRVR